LCFLGSSRRLGIRLLLGLPLGGCFFGGQTLGFRFGFCGFQGLGVGLHRNGPLEVDTGFAQLEQARVGPARQGRHHAVVEAEANLDLAFLTDRHHAQALIAVAFVHHVEATLVHRFVKVHHEDAVHRHVRHGHDFLGQHDIAGFDARQRLENEGVLKRARTGLDLGVKLGVFGFWSHLEDHQAVATDEEQQQEEGQQEQQTREAQHPVDALLGVDNLRSAGTDGSVLVERVGIRVVRVGPAGQFHAVVVAVVVVVGVQAQGSGIVVREIVGQRVVVVVGVHREREIERLGVARVVRPDHDEEGLGRHARWCTADGPVGVGLTSHGFAEHQPLRQVANQFPREHFTRAVDERNERHHRLVDLEVHNFGGVLEHEGQVVNGVKGVAGAVVVGVQRHVGVVLAVGAALELVVVRPVVAVVVKVLHEHGHAG